MLNNKDIYICPWVLVPLQFVFYALCFSGKLQITAVYEQILIQFTELTSSGRILLSTLCIVAADSLLLKRTLIYYVIRPFRGRGVPFCIISGLPL